MHAWKEHRRHRRSQKQVSRCNRRSTKTPQRRPQRLRHAKTSPWQTLSPRRRIKANLQRIPLGQPLRRSPRRTLPRRRLRPRTLMTTLYLPRRQLDHDERDNDRCRRTLPVSGTCLHTTPYHAMRNRTRPLMRCGKLWRHWRARLASPRNDYELAMCAPPRSGSTGDGLRE